MKVLVKAEVTLLEVLPNRIKTFWFWVSSMQYFT